MKSNILLVIGLIVAAFLLTYFVCEDCHGSLRSYMLIGIFSSALWLALWIGNDFMGTWISNYVSWTESPMKRLMLGLLGTFIYTPAVVYIIVKVFNGLTHFDIAFDWRTTYVPIIMTLIISAFMHGRSFLINWRKAELDAEIAIKESAMARYEALKSQINPHFLFNSMNVLTTLVYEDQDKAAKFIKQFSDVYRYVLDTREKEVVTLEEELRFAKAYLYLQEIRFENNLSVKIDVNAADGFIAPLALQLLLENAIKHNVVSSDDPLTINVFTRDGYIYVENNLQKKGLLLESSAGIGLSNIQSRYKFLTDKKVVISEADEKFSVGLPIINSSAS